MKKKIKIEPPLEGYENFFLCHFCQTFDYDDLPKVLATFHEPQFTRDKQDLIKDLEYIIQTKSYKRARKIARECGSKVFDLEWMEKFVVFIHGYLAGIPTELTFEDFLIEPDPEYDKMIAEIEPTYPTDPLTWFFSLFFNEFDNYNQLEDAIHSFKISEGSKMASGLAQQLKTIIDSNKYNRFRRRLKIHRDERIGLDKAKKLALFLYHRFTDTPTTITQEDFIPKKNKAPQSHEKENEN